MRQPVEAMTLKMRCIKHFSSADVLISKDESLFNFLLIQSVSDRMIIMRMTSWLYIKEGAVRHATGM